MLPELSDRLLRDWRSYFGSVATPADLHYLGIPGSVEGGTTTFLAFAPDRNDPLFCVKAHRAIGAEGRVSQEAETLTYLKELGIAGVPQAIIHGSIQDTAYIVSTILPGKPMSVAVGSEGVPVAESAKKDFQRAFSWLEQLHKALRARSTFSAPTAADWPALRREFSDAFHLSDTERSFLDLIEQGLAPVRGGGLQHGDYCRHNILVPDADEGDALRIIDWTDSRRPGWPLHDQFFFASTYFLQARQRPGLEGFLRAFEDTFFSEKQFGRIVRGAIQDSAVKLGIRGGLLALFGVFLVERSLFERRQLLACRERSGLPRFAAYIAVAHNLAYADAPDAQLWIRFFRHAASNRNLLIDAGWGN